jgi:hypothetical protein
MKHYNFLGEQKLCETHTKWLRIRRNNKSASSTMMSTTMTNTAATAMLQDSHSKWETAKSHNSLVKKNNIRSDIND